MVDHHKPSKTVVTMVDHGHYFALDNLSLLTLSPFVSSGYNRGQSSSVSPRGYGSSGSTPHSNGSAYSSTMNGYHSSAGGLGNMGR